MSHTPKCFASHLGLWLMDWDAFSEGCALLAKGMMPTAARRSSGDDAEVEPYHVTEGIAQIPIQGGMTRGSTKFGTSTLEARKAIRLALNDTAVDAIMLNIHSPGGTVEGTGNFADEIRAADRIKPVYAYAEELIASAAYWAGSQARRLTVGAHANVGSIGVMGLAVDSSEQAKMEGLRPIKITSGGAKGDLAPGLPITDEMIARQQDRIDSINATFVDAVARGRRAPIAKAREWNTGEMYRAAVAKTMGMVDAIETYEEAMTYAWRELQAAKRERIEAKRRDVRLRTA